MYFSKLFSYIYPFRKKMLIRKFNEMENLALFQIINAAGRVEGSAHKGPV